MDAFFLPQVEQREVERDIYYRPLLLLQAFAKYMEQRTERMFADSVTPVIGCDFSAGIHEI